MDWARRIHVWWLLQSLLQGVSATGVGCGTDLDCLGSIRSPNSQCVNGYCSNPFSHGGCLTNHPDEVPSKRRRVRVCNSQDSPEAARLGHCRRPQLQYPEVRLLAQDWESSILSTWILQIILSSSENSTSFYDSTSFWPLVPTNTTYDALTRASITGCRGDSQPCAHVATEAWMDRYQGETLEGVEAPQDLGAQGAVHWWIPKFTAERDPTLQSYLGLMGEANRRKLAETFLRPVTWEEYCTDISPDLCSSFDGVASYYPSTPEQRSSYHDKDHYTGYFRKTIDNDCDRNPNCTGHIADYPCYWATYTLPQTHHLNISLTSNGHSNNGGYSQSQLKQIWAAAHRTQSNVMMVWSYPDVTYEEYLRTDSEFTKVVLPAPTLECVNARIDTEANCGNNLTLKLGQPQGACDTYSQPLKKLVATGFQQSTQPGHLEPPLWSPSYDIVSALRVSELQYAQIFRHWMEQDLDKWRFDPRNATCRWVVENLELLESFIPESYPRVLQDVDSLGDPLFVSTLVLAVMASLLVAIASVVAYVKRHTRIISHVQVEFLTLLFGGLQLASLGALVLARPPTDGSCVTTIWFINIGYVLQLVPLMVRIYSINRLASSGKHMQRVHLDVPYLFRTVLVAVFLVVVFLVAWTSMDAPASTSHFSMANKVTDNGESVILVSDACNTTSNAWLVFSFSWQAGLLFPAVVLAFSASRVVGDLNDTKAMLAVLVVHALALVMQAIAISVVDESDQSELMAYTSLIVSVDSIASVLVYMLPKVLANGGEVGNEFLPDLFLNATIMLADIEGFTSWSSAREPVQVFKFLETLYEEFDVIAERHKAFKVETTGGTYVAAAGLPEARPDHAVIMARFASDCMKKMKTLGKKMEVQFGPDTGDMTLKIGMHSGPVTGGFLKGKQSRFQLFGDTMTTAYLIHDSGETEEIHISEECANSLIQAGKKKWITKRNVTIHTSEKGELQTYWLTRDREAARNVDPDRSSGPAANPSDLVYDEAEDINGFDSEQRWVEWNADILLRLLKKIVARRSDKNTTGGTLSLESLDLTRIPLDEFQEVIELPRFDKEAARRQRSHQEVVIPHEIAEQLRDFVAQIAGMHGQNPYHNFAHTSYVVMAVTKYLNRIIAASEMDLRYDDTSRSRTQAAIHDHTYGITSDPLTQFACIFSALIHDVDHPGVPNPQYVKENQRLATVYQYRSVAEQKSFDISWDLFMEPSFSQLRSFLCLEESELLRFRQLVVNSVIATDLGDKEMKGLRDRRWEKAFINEQQDPDPNQRINRKATIVIEHLIQAADVAHACQHWNMFRKWNERLFEECYVAYQNGRGDKNPAKYWYEGEIGFFDFYVIPLSKKLRDCGVFGPTSDENLNYAQSNRAAWVKDGEQLVSDMLVKAESVHLTGATETVVFSDGSEHRHS